MYAVVYYEYAVLKTTYCAYLFGAHAHTMFAFDIHEYERRI